ncbi:hypothetical protein CVT26_002611 [Gymnopilus dilepis]|uniref:Uncharacterized protein n=1 Tax=Gymnopilus dilepis TaxID=231916 RepID=A0A409VF69_9AGAR|nr:hypothetical protein CVT26_002611 [Gymnopilus dilepis]
MKFNSWALPLCFLTLPLSVLGTITLQVVGGVVHSGSVQIQWTRSDIVNDSADFFISCINTATSTVEQTGEVFLLSNTKTTGTQPCIIDTAGPYKFTATDRISKVVLASTPVFPVQSLFT